MQKKSAGQKGSDAFDLDQEGLTCCPTHESHVAARFRVDSVVHLHAGQFPVMLGLLSSESESGPGSLASKQVVKGVPRREQVLVKVGQSPVTIVLTIWPQLACNKKKVFVQSSPLFYVGAANELAGSAQATSHKSQFKAAEQVVFIGNLFLMRFVALHLSF